MSLPWDVIEQFEIGNLRNFVYLILDESNKKAAWVDPHADLSKPFTFLERHGFELTAVLLTHTHHDHVGGVAELARRYPKLPIYVHPLDQDRLESSLLASGSIRDLRDQDVIPVGNLAVQVLHTPGHSPGECCYFVETENQRFLLTGDTLFIRDCGRTDFVGGSNTQMFESLQRIKSLPQDTIILPGHHYQPESTSTLEKELAESPPLRCRSIDELAQLP
jgi:glyoxylase-like metal-dependent hydrolase (beta-lactamase superfamily II)